MQKDVWEKEYRKPKLVTGGNEPQTSVKDFLRWLRREQGVSLENLHILDLGCGNGKNSNYIGDLDPTNFVIGIDISETALAMARDNKKKLVEENEKTKMSNNMQNVEYIHQSIGEPLSFLGSANGTFDLALDVTASNSLSEKERTVYLSETWRLLKHGGYFFVRALCKDGDTNAQSLLKLHPGKEKDTYIMPGLKLVERVFSKQDFIDTYSPADQTTDKTSPHFNILHLEKEIHYSKFEGRSFKRNFWLAYLQK